MTPEQAQKKVNAELDAFHECIMNELLVRTKNKTPVDTGRLRAGWKREGHNQIVNDVPYAKYIEYGTRYIKPVGMMRRTAAELPQIEKKCAAKTLNK